MRVLYLSYDLVLVFVKRIFKFLVCGINKIETVVITIGISHRC